MLTHPSGRLVNGGCAGYRGPSPNARVIECIILVHNFRTEIVGHNQISTVFAPEYKRVINIHGYDRILQYYLQPGNYETDDEAELMEENFGAKQDEVGF
jgi:hypothetical protein